MPAPVGPQIVISVNVTVAPKHTPNAAAVVEYVRKLIEKYGGLFPMDEDLRFRINRFDWTSRTRGFGRLLDSQAVKEQGSEVIFLRQVIPGGSEKSFGIHVARLAGLPSRVVERAEEILGRLEESRRGEGDASQGRRGEEEKAKLLLWIVVATVPTGLMGILFKDWFESLFSRPKTVGLMLLVTGGVLWLTRTVKRKEKTTGEMGAIDALIIGIAQGVAIIPGISRSGATISTGLFRGLNRELAGKFSFLLSIPAIPLLLAFFV